METRIRLREAIEFAKRQGKKIKKKDLAGKIFTYTTQNSAYIRMNNYERGISTNIDRVRVGIICKELGVDANFLFGVNPMSNLNTQRDGESESGTVTSTPEGG